MIEEIQLSEKYKIYKSTYNGEFSLQEFLKWVKINNDVTIHTNNNSVFVEIETPCFSSINKQIIDIIQKITGKVIQNYSVNNWIYTQRKNFNLEWMHQHIFVHPGKRSKILSDFTFTFYLQIPIDLQEDEGHIIFQTEDKKIHKYLPKVGEIYVFPADLLHTAKPTSNSDLERIVYAGNICIDIENQNSMYKKTI